MKLEERMVEYLKPLFGDMATLTFEMQKDRLNLDKEGLSVDDYILIAKEVRTLCKEMAGEVLADKIYNGLIDIIENN